MKFKKMHISEKWVAIGAVLYLLSQATQGIINIDILNASPSEYTLLKIIKIIGSLGAALVLFSSSFFGVRLIRANRKDKRGKMLIIMGILFFILFSAGYYCLHIQIKNLYLLTGSGKDTRMLQQQLASPDLSEEYRHKFSYWLAEDAFFQEGISIKFIDVDRKLKTFKATDEDKKIRRNMLFVEKLMADFKLVSVISLKIFLIALLLGLLIPISKTNT